MVATCSQADDGFTGRCAFYCPIDDYLLRRSRISISGPSYAQVNYKLYHFTLLGKQPLGITHIDIE